MSLSVGGKQRKIALWLVLIIIFELFVCGVIAFAYSYGNTLTIVRNRIVWYLKTGGMDLFAEDESYFNLVEQQIGGAIYDGEEFARLNAIKTTLCYDNEDKIYFTDIDYESDDSAAWPATLHLARAGVMARKYLRTEGAISNEYKQIALRLVRYWLVHDYQNDNWWQNEVAVPWMLGDVCIILKDELSTKEIRRALKIISRGVLSKHYSLRNKTGANILWYSGVTLRYAALTRDKFEGAFAIAAVKNSLTLDLARNDGEGIQTDGSFFQHGTTPYTGGYGRSYVESAASVFWLITGTKAMPGVKAMRKFSALVLNGLQYMSHGNQLDYISIGRQVSRVDSLSLTSFVDSLKILLNVSEFPRKQELKAYIESIETDTPQDIGTRYFDYAAMLVSHYDGVYMSFKGGAPRMHYTESINGENLLAYNLSYGTNTTIMRTGEEYTNIAPLWDWSRLPGTTAVPETDTELAAHEGYGDRSIGGSFDAKVKDDCGVIYMKTAHEGISINVACIMSEHGMVVLGSNIEEKDSRPLVTTLEQCNYAGSYEVNGEKVKHNGFVYSNLDEGTHLSVSVDNKQGNFRRVNEAGSTTMVNGDIFLATVAPSENGTYAYSVQTEEKSATPFVVIINNEEAQAVLLPDGRIAAVFYKKTSFEWDGEEYSGSKGKILIIEPIEDEESE